jgi:hypothetical protein
MKKSKQEYGVEGNYQTPNNEEKNSSEIGRFSSFNLAIRISFSKCLLAPFLSAQDRFRLCAFLG